MKRRALIAIASAAIVVAIGFWLYRTRTTGKDGAESPTAVAQMRAEIEQLKREQSSTARSLALLASSSSNASLPIRAPPANNAPDAGTRAPEEQRLPPQKELSVGEILDRLEDRFHSQPEDRAWSESSGARVKAQVTAGLPADSAIVSIACRQTMCRAEVAHKSLDAHRSFISSIIASPTGNNWEGPSMATLREPPSNRGEITTIAFFGKPGVNLSGGDDSPEPRGPVGLHP